MSHYQRQLDQRTLNFLYQRGLTPDTIKLFKIGTAKSFYEELRDLETNQTKDITVKVNKKFPLFSDRIIFPIINIHNQIQGYSARYFIDDGFGKYINSRYLDKSTALFGEHTIKDSKIVGFSEGQIDACLAYQNLKLPTVAPLGSAVNKKHLLRLKAMGVKAIVAMGDNDKAGVKFNIEVFKYCMEIGLSCVIGVIDPQYNDLGDLGIELRWRHITLTNGYEWLFTQYDKISKPKEKEEFHDKNISPLDFKWCNLKTFWDREAIISMKQFTNAREKYNLLAKYAFGYIMYYEVLERINIYDALMLETHIYKALKDKSIPNEDKTMEESFFSKIVYLLN